MIDPDKLDGLVAAMKAGPDAQLMVVGNPLPDELRAWAAERGLEIVESTYCKPGHAFIVNCAALGRIDL